MEYVTLLLHIFHRKIQSVFSLVLAACFSSNEKDVYVQYHL